LRDVIEPRTGCKASLRFIGLSNTHPLLQPYPARSLQTHTLSLAHYCSAHRERSVPPPLICGT